MQTITTFQLLWGATWRGALWGIAAGTTVGVIYGALVANALSLFALFTQTQAATFKPEDLVRLVAAVLFLALIGGIVGGLFGMPTGIGVGLVNGLLLGILTRAFFFPLTDARRYRRIVGAMSALLSIVGTWLGFGLIIRLYAKNHDLDLFLWVLLAAVPSLIAGAYAAFLSQHIARWYERAFAS